MSRHISKATPTTPWPPEQTIAKITAAPELRGTDVRLGASVGGRLTAMNPAPQASASLLLAAILMMVAVGYLV